MSRYVVVEFDDHHGCMEFKQMLGELVRCKECRYCKKKRGTFKGEPIIFYRCTENNRDVEADGFCSWGEREGE